MSDRARGRVGAWERGRMGDWANFRREDGGTRRGGEGEHGCMGENQTRGYGVLPITDDR
jgi:hypothetical protein